MVIGRLITSTMVRTKRFTTAAVTRSPKTRSATLARRTRITTIRSNRKPRNSGLATGIMPSTSYQ